MKKLFNIVLFLVLILMPVSIFAAQDYKEYKFSNIDLRVNIPSELDCLTRTTTNNNAYLEKIGAKDANEVQTMMTANNIYLEAFPNDISYEIAIIGFKAAEGLSDLNSLNESELKKLFDNYIVSQSENSSKELEEMQTDSLIKTVNDIPYFVTEITGMAKDRKKIYTRKYYTINRGYVYVYSLQSNNRPLTDEMTDNLDYIVNSAKYVKVKKSVFENGVLMETFSSVITVGIPIAILALILLFLTKVGRKGREKLAGEEAKLRAEYKEKHRG